MQFLFSLSLSLLAREKKRRAGGDFLLSSFFLLLSASISSPPRFPCWFRVADRNPPTRKARNTQISSFSLVQALSRTPCSKASKRSNMANSCIMIGETASLTESFVVAAGKFSSQITAQSGLICKPLLRNARVARFNGQSTLNLSRKAFHSGNSLPCKGLGHVGYGLSHKLALTVRAKAYEGGKSDVFPEGSSDAAIEPKEEVAQQVGQRMKIGIYFATWWALNVVFNIYNKKVLNVFPYPWLTSTLSLAAGSLIMLASWVTRIAEAPDVDFDFWKALAPVALAHTIGHVAATVSMSKVAVSFTHIIKSAEPAFSVLVSRFILGEHFPLPVYLSLIPIIGGCGLAALTELNFNMTGFMGAMISNLAFVFRNIFSKKGMKGKSVGGMNYYACLSILSLVFLTPFAFAVEGPKLWVEGWQSAVQTIGPHFAWWVVAQSVFYHLYNQVSYMSLNEISPLTFSVGNTMKRVSVIVSSIIIFHTAVRPINAAGAAVAILGTFLYSQAKQ